MADPTELEIQTQISNMVDLLEEARGWCELNANNFADMEQEITKSLDTDFPSEITSSLATMRSRQSSVIANAMIVGMLGPMFLQYAKFFEWETTNLSEIFRRLRTQFDLDGTTVESRGITFGSALPDGANTGDGTINRLTVDRNGDPLEAVVIEEKTFKCFSDESSGAVEHEEQFEFRGQTSSRDDLEQLGSGASAILRARSARNAGALVSNPSFSRVQGTPGALIAISGWTPVGSISNYDVDAVNFYRGYRGDTTPYALKILADDNIIQPLSSAKFAFKPAVPTYLQLAYNASVGGVTAGTLTVRWGSLVATVDLSAAGPGWQILRFPLDQSLWYPNWNVTDAQVEIEVTGLAGGTLLVDDFIAYPMDQLNGTWYCVVGGQAKFLYDDRFTLTDTETGAKIQYWLSRGFLDYLNSSDTPTWPDP